MATVKPAPQLSSTGSFSLSALRTPSFTSRTVSPRRSVPRAVVLVQQPTHSVLGYFEDRDVEQQFQIYFRREYQTSIELYMVFLLAIVVGGSFLATNKETLAITEAYVKATLASDLDRTATATTGTSSGALWFSDASFSAITATLFTLAALCTVSVWRRRDDYRFQRSRLDPTQVVLLVFSHLLLAPIILVLLAGVEKQAHLGDQLKTLQDEDARLVTVVLGEGFVDILLVTELFFATFFACVLRLQFPYFCVIALELFILAGTVTGTHETTLAVTRRRVSTICAFVIILLLIVREVLGKDDSARREFLTSFHLVTESRRRSSTNLDLKEELSGKLHYQLHYEMGDILRILCQLKLKMTATEKQDIDKIITALVRNQDLFEVTLDSVMPEYDEEVQGWLHMMDVKDHQAADKSSSRVDSRISSRHGSALRTSAERRSRHVSTSHEILRIASSRRFSSKNENEPRISSSDLSAFLLGREAEQQRVDTDMDVAPTPPPGNELSRWLLDRLQYHFFVDMFYLEQHCVGPLQAVLVVCVQLNGFISRLGLNEHKLAAFSAAVEARYVRENPYHNSLHAAAVVADINFYLRRVHLNVDDTTLFVGLVAAAAHDMAHPGVSNGFLVATKSKLAITYSDDSVLERMHVAELYRLLAHDELDVFSHMGQAERTEARKIIIGMVLATDLARHFQRISLLKTKKFAVSEEARGLELSLLMETLLMLADLGHTAKPFTYHQKWAERISEEFFRQGEAEEQHKLPVSPLCDRRQANLPRSQVTFLTLLALPLFETAGQVFAIDEYDSVVSELHANITTWKERIEHTEGAALETMSLESVKPKPALERGD